MKSYPKRIDNYILTQEIGKGKFGQVYLCEVIANDKESKKSLQVGSLAACKVLPRKSIEPPEAKKYFEREIESLTQVDHENVLGLVSARKTKNNIYLFTQYCNGGSLKNFVNLLGGKLNEDLTRIITLQIVEGLNYLHSLDIMHRDLKLDNIFLHFPEYSQKGVVTVEYIEHFDYTTDIVKVIIGDLGFAKKETKQNIQNSFCGTYVYMAPEIMKNKEYDSLVDIWSFGVILYELLTGSYPFYGNNLRILKENIEKGKYGLPKDLLLSYSCIDLLNRCLQFDTKKRITHEELLEHSFFNTENELPFQDIPDFNEEDNKVNPNIKKCCAEELQNENKNESDKNKK